MTHTLNFLSLAVYFKMSILNFPKYLGEEDVAQGFGSVNVHLQIVNKRKSKQKQKQPKRIKRR